MFGGDQIATIHWYQHATWLAGVPAAFAIACLAWMWRDAGLDVCRPVSVGRGVAIWLSTCAFALAVAAVVTGDLATSAANAAAAAVVGAPIVAGLRAAFCAALRSGRVRVRPIARAVVVGAGEEGRQFAAQQARQHASGIELVGFVDDRRTRIDADRVGPLLGDVDNIRELVNRFGVTHVFVALPGHAGQRIDMLAERLRMMPVLVHAADDSMALAGAAGSADAPRTGIGRRLSEWPMARRSARLLKMAEDRVGAALLLLLLAPLMIAAAIAIKLDSPGPVFYRQTRRGFNGNTFRVWKFRSMQSTDCDTTGTRQTARGDARITRVGRVLRKYSLDELPQLFNVLLGEMSIVGPRPHPENMMHDGRLVSEIYADYMARYRMRPGLIGMAQIAGFRGIVDSDEHLRHRLDLDIAYIRNWSLLLDIKLLLRGATAAWRDPTID